MLSRISVVRSAPRLFVVPVRYKTSSVEGSVAQSKGFSKKEKAHEDEYVHRHELELLQKIRNEGPSMLASACISRHAPLVVELVITGFISTRIPPLYIFCDTLASAIEKFTNLSKITLCPSTFHETFLAKSLEILPSLTHLRDLTVNSSCMGSETVPLLVQINQLCKLTLHSPGRLILNALPEWLERLSPTLIGLHLKDNCGSITPGVLNSFVPHIREHLRELTLGLSYSLTDDDVFTALTQIPNLERLQLLYYLQLSPPKTVLRLTRLRSFTFLVDTVPSTRSDALALCRWIKRIISNAPLEVLRLVCDDPSVTTAHVPVDNIVDHLVTKHHTTLRVLDLAETYVGLEATRAILTRCVGLEELCLAARREVLVSMLVKAFLGDIN
ncbi:hypothetical protein DXG03_001390 [Asterophora parasitica]|uniref:Uncharacterized protein n=1 Tax=Asterophora parasitica TaxID=117018 RepID=A0A9P7KCU4_9AGAR|nr:hypothetical protein DXG03_001390 [Asterophora parasitica]